MTVDSLADLRSRSYEAYATQHAGCGGDEAAALVYRRDIRLVLPPPAAGPVVELGCGRGEFVRLLKADNFDAEGTARSFHQLAVAAGFESVLSRSSPPFAYGLASAGRALVWQVVSACYRIALAAETGTLRGHIVTQNLAFAVRKGAAAMKPVES